MCYFRPLIQNGSTEEKIGTNACMVKKYIYLGPENADAPGAPPRRYGAPIAIMFYYLDRDFR